jgi:hypothetical protein
VLIRVLLPTFGKPTRSTVTLWVALGLYALRRRNNAGAVPEARFVRWCEPAERKGECRGCVGEVFEPFLGILVQHQIYKHMRKVPHNVDDQRSAERILRRCTRTHFIENEQETLSLHFAPSHLLLYPPATTPSRITRVENEDDDAGLVDEFVQHADVMPP